MATIKTKNGVVLTVNENSVEVGGVVIESGGNTAPEIRKKICVHALRKIAGFCFGTVAIIQRIQERSERL